MDIESVGQTTDPTARLLRAAKLRREGAPSSARELLDALLDTHHSSAVVQMELGLTSLALGHGRTAIEAFAAAVRLDPSLRFAWKALEIQLMLAGRGNAADKVRAGAIRASLQRQDLLEASTALAQDRLDEAEALLRAHLTRLPTDVFGMYLLAEVGARLGRLPQAANFLARCIALAPDFEAARALYTTLLLRQDNGAAALAQAEWLVGRDSEHLGYRQMKAAALEQVGDYEAALSWGDGPFRKFPDHAQAWMRRGHLLRVLGRAGDSIAAYRRALELREGSGEAYWGLANLKTYRFSASDIAAMEQAIQAEGASETDRIYHGFALGKAMEDERSFQAAFQHYAAANALQSRHLKRAPLVPDENIPRAKKVFSEQFFAERTGLGALGADPIFVVGLPRSGSTLIEQILASHSQIEGTRELPHLWEIAEGLAGDESNDTDAALLSKIGGMNAQTLSGLGEAYLRAASAHRRAPRPFFVDKMPGNYRLIGLIQVVLPNAKIVDARRHPMATGWACFRQNFGAVQGFSNDLSDIGRYYRDYVELMAHFDAVLPGRVHRVIHEQLVHDPEGEIRRLLAYCGLPFEESCLRFHENPRAVRTPSSEQVRQPIFTHGLNHWRNFEPWLGPLKAALGPVLDAYPDAPSF